MIACTERAAECVEHDEYTASPTHMHTHFYMFPSKRSAFSNSPPSVIEHPPPGPRSGKKTQKGAKKHGASLPSKKTTIIG